MIILFIYLSCDEQKSFNDGVHSFLFLSLPETEPEMQHLRHRE
jgi:hypothetical protein